MYSPEKSGGWCVKVLRSATPASDGVVGSPLGAQSGSLSFLLVFLLVLLKIESKESSIHAGLQRFFDSVPATKTLFLEHSRSLKTRYFPK